VEKRGYRMTNRAEQVDQTRQRIVEATVHLHGTVGPAHTTVSAIAEEAGVTRLTVYRHFPDDVALFAACTAHWAAQQQIPDLDRWTRIPDPRRRVMAALADVYRYYGGAEPMLSNSARDAHAVPEFVRERGRQRAAEMADVILGAWPARQRTPKRRALVAHALSFSTWQSLCSQQGLSQRDAVMAMAKLIVGR
jgi:AcrR family transcriptional regulator